MNRAPSKIRRTWYFDSRHWDDYLHRTGDIVISTYPKSGTAWVQRIVSLLVFQSTEIYGLNDISPCIEQRTEADTAARLQRLSLQKHRRFLKTHLSLDELPFYEDVQYLHVARDGLDSFMSLHNQMDVFSEKYFSELDAAGLADETIGRPYPRPSKDIHAFYASWMETEETGFSANGYFEIERCFWAARKLPNVLLIHFNDLKTDLSGEMRRIGEFLKIDSKEKSWDDFVAAATFETMQKDQLALLPTYPVYGRADSNYFFKGTNERWRGVLNDAEVTQFRQLSEKTTTPALRRWLTHGRLLAGDPAQLDD